ncbi:VanZ family protein [Angustibacter aerolatus]
MSTGTRDRLLLGAAVVLQLAVLYAPRAPSTGQSIGLDKLVHAAVFGLVALAAVRCGLRPGPVALVLVAHAVVSELLQGHVLPHRSGDPWDAVADTAGALLGLWAARRGRAS